MARGTSGAARDPFVAPAAERPGIVPETLPRPHGLAGLSIGEVSLRGTLETPTGSVAILQGGGRSYVVRAGDDLFDGSISAITPGSVVITEHGSRADHAPSSGAHTILRVNRGE